MAKSYKKSYRRRGGKAKKAVKKTINRVLQSRGIAKPEIKVFNGKFDNAQWIQTEAAGFGQIGSCLNGPHAQGVQADSFYGGAIVGQSITAKAINLKYWLSTQSGITSSHVYSIYVICDYQPTYSGVTTMINPLYVYSGTTAYGRLLLTSNDSTALVYPLPKTFKVIYQKRGVLSADGNQGDMIFKTIRINLRNTRINYNENTTGTGSISPANRAYYVVVVADNNVVGTCHYNFLYTDV